MRDPDFVLRCISLGAGVQSSVLYLMAARGLLTPRPDLAIFADTQDEPAHVYRQLDFLEAEAGAIIPIERVTAGKLSEEVIRSIQETPSQFIPIPTWVQGEDGHEKAGRRQCTRSHKTEVIARAIKARSGRKSAELWLGISTDEVHRAKPSRYPYLTHRWPLLFDHPMRRGDCLVWMESNGYPKFEKSSCVYCPYRSDRDWRAIKDQHPEEFERAVAFEERMRALKPSNFLHNSCTPLAGIDFSIDRSQADLFGNECEGVCGV
jgi:hypothetical protein